MSERNLSIECFKREYERMQICYRRSRERVVSSNLERPEAPLVRFWEPSDGPLQHVLVAQRGSLQPKVVAYSNPTTKGKSLLVTQHLKKKMHFIFKCNVRWDCYCLFLGEVASLGGEYDDNIYTHSSDKMVVFFVSNPLFSSSSSSLSSTRMGTSCSLKRTQTHNEKLLTDDEASRSPW